MDPTLNFANWVTFQHQYLSHHSTNTIKELISKGVAKEPQKVTVLQKVPTQILQLQNALQQKLNARIAYISTQLNVTDAQPFRFPIQTSDLLQIVNQVPQIDSYSTFQSMKAVKDFVADILQCKQISQAERTSFYKERLSTMQVTRFRADNSELVDQIVNHMLSKLHPQYIVFKNQIYTDLIDLLNLYRLTDEPLVQYPSSGIAAYNGLQNICGLFQLLSDSQVELMARFWSLHLFKSQFPTELIQLVGLVQFILKSVGVYKEYQDVGFDVSGIEELMGMCQRLRSDQRFIVVDYVVQSDFRIVAVVIASILIQKAVYVKNGGSLTEIEMIVRNHRQIDVRQLLKGIWDV
ncbi:Hypothetical_protein [Hexamita inflata]|uniref:Hypothetical_protein n=1 Tax=Hexamita inflata TaxID=28002 RepID=A0AA86UVG7_9EUKA|nr:Hypothetical protein HINF_LOCUS54077 [Hexamita inflata]